MNSYICSDEFVWISNVLKEYNETKEEKKNPETSVEYMIQNNGNLLCQL